MNFPGFYLENSVWIKLRAFSVSKILSPSSGVSDPSVGKDFESVAGSQSEEIGFSVVDKTTFVENFFS